MKLDFATIGKDFEAKKIQYSPLRSYVIKPDAPLPDVEGTRQEEDQVVLFQYMLKPGTITPLPDVEKLRIEEDDVVLIVVPAGYSCVSHFHSEPYGFEARHLPADQITIGTFEGKFYVDIHLKVSEEEEADSKPQTKTLTGKHNITISAHIEDDDLGTKYQIVERPANIAEQYTYPPVKDAIAAYNAAHPDKLLPQHFALISYATKKQACEIQQIPFKWPTDSDYEQIFKFGVVDADHSQPHLVEEIIDSLGLGGDDTDGAGAAENVVDFAGADAMEPQDGLPHG